MNYLYRKSRDENLLYFPNQKQISNVELDDFNQINNFIISWSINKFHDAGLESQINRFG